ncbi:MAG TPA: VOC family protein [Actinomycetes bacterium]
MTIPARVSLVTLGVADVARSLAFYRRLGWEAAVETDGFAVLRTSGTWVALYPQGDLSRDMGDPPPAGAPRRTSLAVNVESPDEVDAALEDARASGGSLLAAGRRAEWGGYTGYFADPDGHAWEVAHNPLWPLDERGVPRIDQGP